MKRNISKLLFVLFLLLLSCNQSDSTEFVGSVNSNIYHYTKCKWAKKIKPTNLIEFNSIGEAKSAGYRACKVCKPPKK